MMSCRHSGAMTLARSKTFTLGIFGTKITAEHLVERPEHEVDPLLEGDEEAGHSLIGDGQPPGRTLREEIRDDAAAAADHVPVANDTEFRLMKPRVGVGRDKQFVGAELGGAIEVDRVRGLVRAEGQ